VKIKSITVVGESGEQHPTKMKAFKNRDDIDFGLAESLPPLQEWDLVEGENSYETRITQFYF
jgi:hypothetical protein